MNTPCIHENAVVKKYVGWTDTYIYCPDCLETWGGEETPRNKAVVTAAAEADARGLRPPGRWRRASVRGMRVERSSRTSFGRSSRRWGMAAVREVIAVVEAAFAGK